MKSIIIPAVLFLLTACSGASKPPVRDSVACADDQTFQTAFARDGSQVEITTHRGQKLILPAQASAEGDFFSNGMTSLIVHDNGEMMIEQDGLPLMTGCQI